MRVEIPFAGSSKEHRSPAIADQRCINWYPEIVKDDQGKERFRVLIGAPGKTLLAQASGHPLRAIHMSSSKYQKYWVVFYDTCYEVLANGTINKVGNLLTNQGEVYIADNGTHLLIVDGSNTGYVLDITTGVWTPDLHAVDADFIGGDHVVFIQGYFFVIQPGSNVINSCEAPYGTAPTVWDNAVISGFSTALSDAGPLIALGTANDLLWAIGDYSTAVFQNTGNPVGFPFSIITGTPINIGIAARAALKELNGALIWPGKTKKGAGFIVRTSGLSLSIISDHDLDYNIGKYAQVSDAYADVYLEEGHSFYCITFPTGNKTWVWDQATNEWHERSSYGLGRDRAKGHIYFMGKHIVGDSTNGKLYQTSLDVFTEDASPLIATRRCQKLKHAKNPLEIPSLIIDVETGVGIGGDGAGSDPQMELIYSRDNGKNWSEPLYSSMGRRGDSKALVRYPRLGTSEEWAFEIRVSDPVKRNVMAAYVEA